MDNYLYTMFSIEINGTQDSKKKKNVSKKKKKNYRFLPFLARHWSLLEEKQKRKKPTNGGYILF